MSLTIGTAIDCLVCPGEKVRVPDFAEKSLPPRAPPLAVAYLTVIVLVEAAVRTTPMVAGVRDSATEDSWSSNETSATAPSLWSPQQTNVPSALVPQLCQEPAVIWVSIPAGGALWPLVLSPQQASVPFSLRPHECRPPAATCVNAPRGGAPCPRSLRPQQASVRSTLRPHV